MSAALQISLPTVALETLTGAEWCRILGISTRAFRKRQIRETDTQLMRGGSTKFYALAALPADYQSLATQARLAQNLATFRDVLGMLDSCAARASKPDTKGRAFSEYPSSAQARALKRMGVMAVYLDARDAGRGEAVCNQLAQQKWRQVFPNDERLTREKSDRSVDFKKIQRLKTRVDAFGGRLAPKEAYLDGKSTDHANQRKDLPAELKRDFQARMTNSAHGVPSVGAVLRDYQALWDRGEEITGLGCRIGDEPFPVTIHQMERIAPARVVRELAGRGKFATRTKGLLAAPQMDWTNVEPMRVVMFDDKTLDVHVLTDDGLRSFRPVIYIAYCAGTGRVLSFIAREEGRMTQLDIEGLQAAVLRDHGFGGPESHWPSRWIFERGTLAISDARKNVLERVFNGHLQIGRTDMVKGRTAPGDWTQAAKGNFFGKGRLEAFMGTLDWLAHTLPGQTGNEYGAQPAILGDTTLTLQKIINAAKNPKNRPARSLIEESLLTAAMSRALVWLDNGENVSGFEASRRNGGQPKQLYFSDFVNVLGELFRAHNNRRDHRMQGFETIRVPHPNSGGMMLVSESPNDKAQRMLERMELQGRRLVRPADADIVLLLHKVKRVVVKANGVDVEGIRYWHERSAAQRDAASIMGGARPFLALYNPVAPDALYLLANPPGHLPASAQVLPKGFVPQLYEILPRYIAADPTDQDACDRRRDQVATFNSQFSRAAARAMEPILTVVSREREALSDRLEPLRAVVRSGAPIIAPDVLPASDLSGEMTSAEEIVTRLPDRPSYADTLPFNQRTDY